jgi:hypothetical protein
MIEDMTDQPLAVPSGPYFHGTRQQLRIGQELVGGTVDPAFGDDRLMVWATIDVDQAFEWAAKRYRSVGPTLYVYELELYEAKNDANVSQDVTGVVTSVMAPRGRVVRLVGSMTETEWQGNTSATPVDLAR